LKKNFKKVGKYHGSLQYMWSGVSVMDVLNLNSMIDTLMLTSLCMKNNSERRWCVSIFLRVFYYKFLLNYSYNKLSLFKQTAYYAN